MRLRPLFFQAIEAIITWQKEQHKINEALENNILILEKQMKIMAINLDKYMELLEARRESELKKGK